MATPASYFKGKCKSDEFVTVPGTATSTAAAATINKQRGKITTESLTTAAAGTYTMTLTNSLITTASSVFVTVGTAGTGEPSVHSVVLSTGSCTIKIRNNAAAAAFNAILTIDFLVLN